MTEDRLTHLLQAATDFTPSPALRERIAATRPKPRVPWFALSGATAALAAVALLTMPRLASASELLQRAGAESQGRFFSFTGWSFVDGAWRVERHGLSAPGWSRYETVEGALDLTTPGGRYGRLSIDAPVLRRPAVASTFVDDLRLDRHLEALRSLGYRPVIQRGGSHAEGEREIQDVTIEIVGQGRRHSSPR